MVINRFAGVGRPRVVPRYVLRLAPGTLYQMVLHHNKYEKSVDCIVTSHDDSGRLKKHCTENSLRPHTDQLPARLGLLPRPMPHARQISERPRL